MRVDSKPTLVGVAAEDIESNNEELWQITVGTSSGVDLGCTFFLISGVVVTPGQSVTMTCRVENIGGATISESFRTGFYLSADDLVDTSDTLLASCSGLSVPAPDDFVDCVQTASIPTGLTFADYYLGVIVDDQGGGFGQVVENLEANNVRSQMVTVQGTAGTDQAPQVSILDPLNDSNHSTAQITLDYSATDDIGVTECELRIDTQAAVVFPTCADTVLSYVHLEDAAKIFALDFAEPEAFDKSAEQLEPTFVSVGATTSPAGGRAVSFDGTSDRIQPQSFNGGPFRRDFAAWSFEAWVKPSDTAGSAKTLIDVGAGDRGFWVGFQSGELVFAGQMSGMLARVETPYTDTTNWHHVAAVFTGSESRLYVDGVLQASAPTPFTQVNVTDNRAGLGYTNWNDARGGCCGGVIHRYSGAMDEVAMYERSLTPVEVRAHAEGRFLESAHTATITAVDGLGQSAAATVGFTVDGAGLDNAPQLTILAPIQGATPATADIVIDYTATDDFGLHGCEAQLDSGAVMPFATCADFVLSYVHAADPAKLFALDFAEPGLWNKAAPIVASLVEEKGARRISAVGRRNVGTPTTSPLYGQALELNGSERVFLPSPSGGPFHRLFDEWSFQAWIKPDGTSARQTLIELGDNSGFWVGFEGGNLAFAAQQSGVVFRTDAAYADTTNWHHVTAVYDGSELRLYIDGVLQTSAPTSFSSVNVTQNRPAIGYTNWGDADKSCCNTHSFYSGSIDELAMYERALTPAEVLADFEGRFLSGAHTITLTAFDALGQTATDMVGFTVAGTGGTDLPPQLSIVAPGDGSTQSVANMLVDYTASDDGGLHGCTVSLDSGQSMPFTTCADFVLSYVHLQDTAKLFALDFAEPGMWNKAAGASSPLVEEKGPQRLFAGPDRIAVGVPTTSPDYGQAIELDGSERIYFNSPNGGPFHRLFNAWSFEAWVKPTGTTARQTLIELGDNNGFWVGFQGGSLAFAARMSEVPVRVDVPYSDTTNWHHVGAVFDGAELRLYVDGVLQAGAPTLFTSVNVTQNRPALGYTNWGDADKTCCNTHSFYSGSIDELAMYERALTAAQILAHYQGRFLAGSHSLTVTAFDALGQSTSSTSDFTISGSGIDLDPQLTIVSPADGSAPSAANVTVDYTATDDVGLNGCTAQLDSGVALPFVTCADFVLSYVHLTDPAKLYALDFAEPGFWNKAFPPSSPLVEEKGPARVLAGTQQPEIGTPTTSPAYGRALELDGSERIYLDNSDGGPFRRLFNAWSFEAWAKPDSTTARQTLIELGDNNSFWVGFEAGAVSFAARSGNDVARADVPYTDTANWHHVAAAFDGTELRLAVDGVVQTTVPTVFSSVNITQNRPALGYTYWGDAAKACCNTHSFYSGSIDELAMYERALTATEVDEHYQGQFLSGAHSLTLTALDAAGQSAVATSNFTVGGPPPDAIPPTISSAVTPPPNAAGWHNVPALVTFTCQDADSGIAFCTDPIEVSALGSTPIVGFAQDVALNIAETTVTVNVDTVEPIVEAVPAPVANEVGWHNADVTVTFQATDSISGVASASPPASIAVEGAGQLASGSATDNAGNSAPASVTVNLDKTLPDLVVTAPVSGLTLLEPNVEITGTVSDALSGLASITCDGEEAVLVAPDFTCELELATGLNSIDVEVTDVAGNVAAETVEITFVAPPVVTIASPIDFSTAVSSPVTISGTNNEETTQVLVNGVAADVSGLSFSAVVPIDTGLNTITVTSFNASGAAGTATVHVALDDAPPYLSIDSALEGETVYTSSISVAGQVSDPIGAVDGGAPVAVTVNGVTAAVSAGRFLAQGVALSPGANVLTAQATDAAGNMASYTVNVTLQDLAAQPRIEAVSGDMQQAAIDAAVPDPLVVEVKDGGDAPVSSAPVVFKITRGDGEITNGPTTSRMIVVNTDAQGRAEVDWTLGMRAGQGANVVEATAAGYEGKAIFTAAGLPGPTAHLHHDAGDNQAGIAGQPLPFPLVVAATDDGHNRLAGMPITFSVEEGGGNFSGQPSVVVMTDAEGFARTTFTLGPEPGVASHSVLADTLGNTGNPIRFSATAEVAGDPAETAVSGVVLDGTNLPVPGVTMTIPGSAVSAQTDSEGRFFLQPAPVGAIHLVADSTTATRPGTWSSLEFAMVTIPGRVNTLGMPIHILPIDTANSVFVSETQGGTLTLPEIPGFAMEIAPGSATWPGGAREGNVSVTVVHSDKVPMTPNFGQQPRLVITIQPPGIVFDPPAELTYPNLEAEGPGATVEFYSFDHDMERFVSLGTGAVSDDGLLIQSDPGVGVRKSGWHCGGNPPPSGQCQPTFVVVTPNPVVLFPNETDSIGAVGGPGPDGNPAFSWTIDDTNIVAFAAPPQSTGSGTSNGQTRGGTTGNTTIRTRYKNENGAEASASVNVAVVELELRDARRDVEILEGNIAAIDETPRMPALEARLIGGSADFTVDWRLTVSYQTTGSVILGGVGPRDDSCQYPTDGPRTLPADQVWKLEDEWKESFCGGDATLSYTVEGKDERVLTFEIQGENPEAQSTVRERLYAPRYQLIAWWETRFQQFQIHAGNAYLQSYEVGPFSVLRAPDEGYGIGQLTNSPVPSIDKLWNWQDNVLDLLVRALAAQADSTLYNFEVRDGIPFTVGNGTPPNPGVAYPDADYFTLDQLDMETWSRYNSNFRFYNWVPASPSTPGFWMPRLTDPCSTTAGSRTGSCYAERIAPFRDMLRDGQFPPLWIP